VEFGISKVAGSVETLRGFSIRGKGIRGFAPGIPVGGQVAAAYCPAMLFLSIKLEAPTASALTPHRSEADFV
jgi:hypothetical protein